MDSFKSTKRSIKTIDGSFESDPEHCFSLHMMIDLYANLYPDADFHKLHLYANLHDIPELLVNDVSLFDDEGRIGKEERELKAAKEIFAKLPTPLNKKCLDLYMEYDNLSSYEAKIIKALDKIQPIILNLCTKGKNWLEKDIYFDDIDSRKRKYMLFNQGILKLYETVLNQALDKGYLRKR